MLLGTLLRQLQDERIANDLLFALGDVTLAARVEQAAGVMDENVGEYAAGACARFSDGADDEAWLALMTAIERSTDPAATCLRTMLEWSMARDAEDAALIASGVDEEERLDQGGCSGGHGGCGCGSGGSGGHHHHHHHHGHEPG
ncbi:hypothetical protein ACT6QG_03870 [Xanthobacter sp. TB0136]|uniref:hypothetical protein n=1 Tax=Xanthobacter sp. TB0136 TaxID=3459177 RepID=UPI00403A0EEC